MSDRLLSPEDVAQFLQVPAVTLAQWRWRGTGPRFMKVGRHVRYAEQDVATWLAERTAARHHAREEPS